MGYKCGCSCHWVHGVLYTLGIAAAILFVWADLANTQIIGKTVTDFFMWAVILLLVSKSAKMCRRCWNRHGMSGANTCSHPMGCKCGDCDRCK